MTEDRKMPEFKCWICGKKMVFVEDDKDYHQDEMVTMIRTFECPSRPCHYSIRDSYDTCLSKRTEAKR